MGEFVDFLCRFCGYRESDIPLGRGRKSSAELKLFSCPNCKSVGSTWVEAEGEVLCGLCYHPDIRLMSPVPAVVDCPRCGEPARVRVKEGRWE